MRHLFTILLLMCAWVVFPAAAWGQQAYTLTGRVTDAATGKALIGATVVVKGGAPRGSVTDVSGNYAVYNVLPGDTVVFGYIGMEPVEMPVNGRRVINAALKEQVSSLDQVVVVGYGTMKARDLTAPIATVEGGRISKQQTPNPAQALQGMVAGVQVINSGAPGSGPTIRIRGVGSISDMTKPLYVVDGVFVDNIDFINNSDIETLTVLKDASSSAIYGVRAANGVILITTKSGVTGKPVVTYDGYYGVQMPVNLLRMTNRDQYIELRNEKYYDWYRDEMPSWAPLLDPENYPDTDWYAELLRNAPITNHSVDVSGSTDAARYSAGASYLYQEGIMDATNDYRRFNLRGSAEFTVSRHFKMGFRLLASRFQQNLPNNGAWFSAFVNPPAYSVYDPDNEAATPVKFAAPQNAPKLDLGGPYGNPVAAAYYYDNYAEGYQILPVFFAEYNFLKNKFVLRSQYNQDLTFTRSRHYQPQYFVGGSQGRSESVLDKTSAENVKQIFDNTLTYTDAVGRHHFSVMAGMSVRQEASPWLSATAYHVSGLNDQTKYITNGDPTNRYANDGNQKVRGLSYFARGTYNYADRYLATLTFRADGSSKYQQTWGYFPSVGLGWVPTSEKFIQDLNLKPLNRLKLRAAWGKLGNDNVPRNSTYTASVLGAFSSGVFNNVLVPGLISQTVYQNWLAWEVTEEWDFGLDMSMFRNRLTGTVDFYKRHTSNVVFYAPIAAGGGSTELLGNNGSVLNRGWELTFRWSDKTRFGLDYTIGFNLTTIYNVVTDIQNRPDGRVPGALINASFATYALPGRPIGGFYGYQVTGVYQNWDEIMDDPIDLRVGAREPGSFRYADVSGPDGVPDGKVDSDDIIYLGSPIPRFIGGMDLGVSWKGIDFSISLQGQWGNKILNQKRMHRGLYFQGNYDRNFYENRWSGNGVTDYPGTHYFDASLPTNSFNIEDGSYIRIQNVQLGYTIPQNLFPNVTLPKLRIYLSAQRPQTWFDANGFTPEIGGAPNTSGIDNTVYPMQAIYSVGLRATF